MWVNMMSHLLIIVGFTHYSTSRAYCDGDGNCDDDSGYAGDDDDDDEDDDDDDDDNRKNVVCAIVH